MQAFRERQVSILFNNNSNNNNNNNGNFLEKCLFMGGAGAWLIVGVRML